jgi:hypothetical protein
MSGDKMDRAASCAPVTRSQRKRISWLTFLVLSLAFSCAGHRPASDTDSVRNFVQNFYDWYVPFALDLHSDRPSELVVRKRPSDFSPTLIRELKEDSDAQSRVPDEIVGLDFDPFLAAQDPCERYEVVSVRKDKQSFFVSVRGTGGCESHGELDIDAEVVANNSNWLFTNFHYPRLGGDLVTTLKNLRDERKQNLQ